MNLRLFICTLREAEGEKRVMVRLWFPSVYKLIVSIRRISASLIWARLLQQQVKPINRMWELTRYCDHQLMCIQQNISITQIIQYTLILWYILRAVQLFDTVQWIHRKHFSSNCSICDVLDTLILLRWIIFIVLSPQPDHDLSKALILCNEGIFSPPALFWFWLWINCILETVQRHSNFSQTVNRLTL